MASYDDNDGLAKAIKIIKIYPQCPFFSEAERSGGARRIRCESPIPGSSLSLYFRKIRDFETQINLFCCDHYKNCEIYRTVLREKYEGDY